jgi:ribosomal protein S18 acetylase RimI-like enzyme
MTTALVRTRQATADDLADVVSLFGRCTPATLESRFHAPVQRVPERMVRALLAPPGGWSVLAHQGPEVVGHACAAPVGRRAVDIGLLVDDAFQGTGIGTRLVRDLAAAARERGYGLLTCTVAPDNDAVLSTVRRAGLDGVSRYEDGIVEIEVPLGAGVRELELPA